VTGGGGAAAAAAGGARAKGKARYLSMVAGGSGVTPCFDVIREVLQVR
jgi:ferredoxin-NADP reductase